MARANVDPDELRAFAAQLENYINTVDDETARLASAFGQLQDEWDDSKEKEFEEVFEDMVRAVNNFKDSAEEQIPHLRRMAEHAEEYLRS